MSFKSFSTAQGTPEKTASAAKSKNTLAAGKPAVAPDKSATDTGPAKKP